MPTQETELNNLIINKLTKAQYDSITPNENELYVVVDDQGVASWGSIEGNIADQVDLNDVLSTKQDLLTAGENIIIENGVISAISSSAEIDETTISRNEQDKLQAQGTILQNGGYQKYWEGTKAEYNAISVKDPDTLYQVNDDIEDIVLEIPTATISDIGLVKPDGTTVTVDEAGTLSVPLDTKANTDLSNVRGSYDWVTSCITYGDGESGYIRYRNKRIEQWGVATSSASGETEFTMHLPFKDMNYSVFVEPREMGDFFHYAIPSSNQKFRIRVKGSNGSIMAVKVQWRAFGYFE